LIEFSLDLLHQTQETLLAELIVINDIFARQKHSDMNPEQL